MADTGSKTEGADDHSSGEYSGVVEQATIGMSGKAQDMATVISSGNSARDRREANKKKKEEEEKQKTKEGQQQHK
jgi:hypothetical protein